MTDSNKTIFDGGAGQPPFPGKRSADERNNQAVQCLNDGLPDEAAELWQEILSEEPDHVPSLFNYTLFRYRTGELKSQDAVKTLLIHKDLLKNEPKFSVLLAGLMLEIGPETHAAIEKMILPGIKDEKDAEEIRSGMKDPNYKCTYLVVRAAVKDSVEMDWESLLGEIGNQKSEIGEIGKTVIDNDAFVPVEAAKTIIESDPTASAGPGQTVMEGERNNEGTEPEKHNSVQTDAHSSALISHFSLPEIYHIVGKPIESGGMGTVWKVHHSGWNVDLAMKRPKPEMFANEDTKANFINECRYWINLGLHPNIVSCYYVREIEGVPTIFSEWMANGSLEDRIRDHTLYKGSDAEKQARLLDIAIQFARGLHYAHESGLIHQDVKPHNLLLSNTWEAKVSDFGIANARAQLTVKEDPEDGDKRSTRMGGKNIYTPAYCSMEQMDGKKLTRATDIYSWAVSVMEMYYQDVPWANGVIAGMSCRDFFTDCKIRMPAALQELLANCLEMNPDDRPGDFTVVEKKLRSIYQEVTGKSYPRPEPRAAADTADSLNNRALTYIDLGIPEKAEEAWAQALKNDPDNASVIFNRAIHRFRSGKATIQEADDMLGSIRDEALRRQYLEDLHQEMGHLQMKFRLTDAQIFGISADGRYAVGTTWDRYNRHYYKQDYHPDYEMWVMPESDAENMPGMDDWEDEARLWLDSDICPYGSEDLDSAINRNAADCISISGDGRLIAVDILDEDEDFDEDEYPEERVCTVIYEREDPEDDYDGEFPEEALTKFSESNGILNADGSAIAFQKMNEDSEIDGILICDPRTGKTLKEFDADYYFLGFTPSGRVIVLDVENDNEISIRDAVKKDPKTIVKMRGLSEAFYTFRHNAVLNEDETRLLVYTGKRCILWNTLSGEKLYEYSIPDGVPVGTVFIDPTHIFIGFRIQTTDPKQHYVIEYEYLHPADERNSLSKYYYLATVWNAETGALEASEEIDFARICGYPVSKDEVFASGYHVESFFELIHSHPYCPRYISGKKAEFRLSVIEDTRTRLNLQDDFREYLEKARNAQRQQDLGSGFEALTEAMSLTGYEKSVEAVKLWSDLGKSLEKTGVRQIFLTDETDTVSYGKQPIEKEYSEVCNEIFAEIPERFKNNARIHAYEARSFSVNALENFNNEKERRSADGKFLMIVYKTEERRRYGLRKEYIPLNWYGAAIVDTEMKKVVWRRDGIACIDERIQGGLFHEKNLEYCATDSRYLYSLPKDRRVSIAMDPTGTKVVAADETLRIYDTKNDTDRILTQDGPYLYTCFLNGGRNVLCENDRLEVQVLDAESGDILAEYKLPWAEYGKMEIVDDDRILVANGRKKQVCRIQWDYRLLDGNVTGDSMILPAKPVVRPIDSRKFRPLSSLIDSGLEQSAPLIFTAQLSFLEWVGNMEKGRLSTQHFYLMNRESSFYEQINPDEGFYYKECIVNPYEKSYEHPEKAFEKARDEIIRRQDELDFLCGDLLIMHGTVGDPVCGAYFPALCELARKYGMASVAFAEIPYAFETGSRKTFAQNSLEKLRKFADLLIVIDPSRISMDIADKDLKIVDLNLIKDCAFICIRRNFSRLKALPAGQNEFSLVIRKTSSGEEFDEKDPLCMGSVDHQNARYFVYLEAVQRRNIDAEREKLMNVLQQKPQPNDPAATIYDPGMTVYDAGSMAADLSRTVYDAGRDDPMQTVFDSVPEAEPDSIEDLLAETERIARERLKGNKK